MFYNLALFKHPMGESYTQQAFERLNEMEIPEKQATQLYETHLKWVQEGHDPVLNERTLERLKSKHRKLKKVQ